MNVGRYDVRLVPMAAGNVLAVGGSAICSPMRISIAAPDDNLPAELWDPERRSWVTGPTLPRPRVDFVALPLPDGSVIVAGGTTNGEAQSFSSSFKLEPGGTEWVRSGDLTVARSAPAGAVLDDGRVLVAGGFYVDLPRSGRMRVLDSAELYDPAAGIWTRTGPLQVPRQGATAVTLADGRVLLVGGTSDATESGGHDVVATAEIFDPDAQEWAPAGDLPEFGALVALRDGGALIVRDGGPGFRLDPGTGVWTETGTMVSTAYGRMVVALADGRVMAAGGRLDDDPERSADAEIYDPATDRWEAAAAMPAPRQGSAVLLGDGTVLVAGGISAADEFRLGWCPEPAVEALRFVP